MCIYIYIIIYVCILLLELSTIKTTGSVQMPSFHKTINEVYPWVCSCSKRKKNGLIFFDKNLVIFSVWPSFGKCQFVKETREEKTSGLRKSASGSGEPTQQVMVAMGLGDLFSRCGRITTKPRLSQILEGQAMWLVQALPSCRPLSTSKDHLLITSRPSPTLRHSQFSSEKPQQLPRWCPGGCSCPSVWISSGCRDKGPQAGGLNLRKCISSLFCRLEVQDQGSEASLLPCTWLSSPCVYVCPNFLFL